MTELLKNIKGCCTVKGSVCVCVCVCVIAIVMKGGRKGWKGKESRIFRCLCALQTSERSWIKSAMQRKFFDNFNGCHQPKDWN